MTEHRGMFGKSMRRRCEMSLGNQKEVSGSLGMDVWKGKDKVVLVDAFYGDRARRDLAKKAVGRGFGESFVRHEESLRRSCSRVPAGRAGLALCPGWAI